jgi:hypothetical protein
MMRCPDLLLVTFLLFSVADTTPIPMMIMSSLRVHVFQPQSYDSWYLIGGKQDRKHLFPREYDTSDATTPNSRATRDTVELYALGDHNATGHEHVHDGSRDGSAIPNGFLESDSDSGGESAEGNTAVSVASGMLGSGGTGSAVLNHATSGSTSSFCSLLSCTSAAESDGVVNTTTAGTTISHVKGPLFTVTGPLIVVTTRARQLAGRLANITSGLL